MQKIAQMGGMYQKLTQYMQIALQLASTSNPTLAQQIAQDVMATAGGAAPMGGVSVNLQALMANNITGVPKKEHSVVANARQQSNDAAQPDADGAVNTKR